VKINDFYLGWQPVRSRVLQGLLLALKLYNIFISYMDDGIESTLTKFANDTKLGGEVDTSEGKAILEKDLDRLEEWASKNGMKFNKDKCKVLHLGQNNQRVHYRLKSVWLGNSLAESDLGMLVDNKLNVSQRSAAAATKANQVPLYSVLVRPHLEHCVQCWSSQFKKDADRLGRVQTKAGNDQRAGECTLQGKTEGLRFLLPGEGMAQGHLITVFQYLQEHLQRQQKCSLHQLPHGEDKWQWVQGASGEVSSQYKKDIFYSENNQSLEQSPQGCDRVPITGGFQDAAGQDDR